VTLIDDFIGTRFGVDGHLEVVGWDGSRSRSNKMYSVYCHVCKEDSELFGDGIFKRVKGDLVAGNIPCGCSKSVYWTKQQYEVIAKRLCDKVKYTFHGFSGDWLGKWTKLFLTCSKGHSWESTALNNLVSNMGCPECGNISAGIKSEKSDEVMIKSFMASGSFQEGSVFVKSSRKTLAGSSSYWWYECPSCKIDEYTKSGLCSGVFESFSGSLQEGSLPCRCNGQYRWTTEQREYQLAKKCSDRPLDSFLQWETSHVNQKSIVEMFCKDHGVFKASVTQLLDKGTGCPTCSKGGFQYKEKSYVYVLLCDSVISSFTGYGISGCLPQRLAKHKLNLKASGFCIVDFRVFPTDGRTAFKIEKDLKKEFEKFPQNVEGFKSEATLGGSYNNVVHYVETYLQEKILQ
jgi:hypothetical protein